MVAYTTLTNVSSDFCNGTDLAKKGIVILNYTGLSFYDTHQAS